ncbi:MAG: AAA family ATPase [Saprospiraceae bacterium]
MKISHFKISNGFQFDDFGVDLIYPKGHEKEGQPLDKICFIGQSGTGKTTIMEELLYGSLLEKSVGEKKIRSTTPSKKLDLKIKFKEDEVISRVLPRQHHKSVKYFSHIGEPISPSSFYKNLGIISKNTYSLLYFPHSNFKASFETLFDNFTDLKIFSHEDSKLLWSNLAGKIRLHTNDRSKHVFAVANLKDPLERNKKFEELDEWDKKNPSPLGDLADNFLDPILKHFKLSVKTNLENLEESNFINLIDSNNNIVPDQAWSTGTKQILHKTLPIYINSPKKSIIFIDEPENSLYPDIQTKIIEHYTRLGEDCQFFFATHSPLIASNFEPWEIVELKFNEKGKIYRDKYYSGEDHVDNYFIDPRYLRWDSILTEVFDLEVEGNVEWRSKKLLEFSVLKGKLKKIKEKGELKNPSPEVKELIKKYKKAGELLAWKGDL